MMLCTVHDMSPLCAGSLRKRALCPCAGGLFSDIFRVVRVTLTTTDQLGVPCRVRNHSNVMQTVDHLSIEHPFFLPQVRGSADMKFHFKGVSDAICPASEFSVCLKKTKYTDFAIGIIRTKIV